MKVILAALLITFSSLAMSCPDGKVLSWTFPVGYEGWISGFSFYVDGVQVGTAPATSRTATCASAGVLSTTSRIVVRAFREDQESTDSNVLDFNIEAPSAFSFIDPA